MGFYFNEESIEFKVSLDNLSDYAKSVIEEDIYNFSLESDKANRSGFYNRIFTNFYQESDASINERMKSEKIRLEKLFSSESKEDFSEAIKIMLSDFEKNLVKKANSYPKGKKKDFRIMPKINVKNQQILEQELDEDKYYDGAISSYWKAIFEEYARLPGYKRERIFFKEYVDKINLATNRCKMRVKLLSIINSDSRGTYETELYVTPYKLLEDKTGSWNYLVGYSEKIEGDQILPETITSLRLARIAKMTPKSSMPRVLSKAEIKRIESELKIRLVSCLYGEMETFRIKLTKKGMENFRRWQINRPVNYNLVSSDPYIIDVYCNEFQAIYYFFRFGKDAKIISPEATREKMLEMFKEAAENYD